MDTYAPTPSSSVLTVEAGMRRVLEAEGAARESIARCEQEAARTVEQARKRARRIAQRADSLISAIRIKYTNKIARQLAELRDRAESWDGALDLDGTGHSRAVQAVAQLAARLTGGETGGEQ